MANDSTLAALAHVAAGRADQAAADHASASRRRRSSCRGAARTKASASSPTDCRGHGFGLEAVDCGKWRRFCLTGVGQGGKTLAGMPSP